MNTYLARVDTWVPRSNGKGSKCVTRHFLVEAESIQKVPALAEALADANCAVNPLHITCRSCHRVTLPGEIRFERKRRAVHHQGGENG